MKLTVRFFLIVLVLPMVILVVSTVISVRQQQSIISSLISDLQQRTVAEAGNAVASEIARLDGRLFAMARLPQVRRVINQFPSEYDQAAFNQVPGYQEYIETLQAFVDDGVSLAYAVSKENGSLGLNTWIQLPEDYDGRQNDYYTQPITINGVYLTDPYLNPEGVENTDPTAVTISRPVHSSGGEVLGVAAFDIGLSPVVRIVEQIASESQANISLYTASGLYISHPGLDTSSELQSVQTQLQAENIEDVPGVYDQLIATDPSIFTASAAGEKYLYVTGQVPGTTWKIAASLREADVFGPLATQVLVLNSITALVLLAVLVIVLLTLQRTVVVNVVRASSRLHEIASGDGDLTQRIQIARKDEIGILASNFNQFVDKLSQIVTDIKLNLGEGNRVKQELTSSTEQTTSAMNQIAANVASIKEQIRSLDQAIDVNTTSVHRMGDEVRVVTEQLDEQGSMVEESTASVNEMLSSLESVAGITRQRREITTQLAENSHAANEQLEMTNEIFKTGVASNIDQIKEMVETIQGIAGQTNLLAMNAAIEAAHAGEAGKGFAVVSDEIRKLAENSAESSNTISNTIGLIIENIEKTGQMVNRVSEYFSTVIREVNETVNAFSEIESSTMELTEGGRQILQAMTALQEASLKIKKGAMGMSESVQEITQNQGKIRNSSSESSNGISEITIGVQEINQAMNHIQTLNGGLSGIIDTLETLVHTFKTTENT
jgi:methyl-accepting chemotaxis protein